MALAISEACLMFGEQAFEINHSKNAQPLPMLRISAMAQGLFSNIIAFLSCHSKTLFTGRILGRNLKNLVAKRYYYRNSFEKWYADEYTGKNHKQMSKEM